MARRFVELAPGWSAFARQGISSTISKRGPRTDSPVVAVGAGTAGECGSGEHGGCGEDDAVIQAWEKQNPGLALIRAAQARAVRCGVAAIGRRPIAHVRRSQLDGEIERVLLLDSIGELGGLFRLADVGFCGRHAASARAQYSGARLLASPSSSARTWKTFRRSPTSSARLRRWWIFRTRRFGDAVRGLPSAGRDGARALAAAEARAGDGSRGGRNHRSTRCRAPAGAARSAIRWRWRNSDLGRGRGRGGSRAASSAGDQRAT